MANPQELWRMAVGCSAECNTLQGTTQVEIVRCSCKPFINTNIHVILGILCSLLLFLFLSFLLSPTAQGAFLVRIVCCFVGFSRRRICSWFAPLDASATYVKIKAFTEQRNYYLSNIQLVLSQNVQDKPLSTCLGSSGACYRLWSEQGLKR